jgi:Flp pilus assembly protein TadG
MELSAFTTSCVRPKRSRQRGSAIVEFALIAPIMITMAFGTFELHSLMRASETVSRACLQTADLVARERVTTTARLNDIRAVTAKSLGLTPAQANRLTIEIASIAFNDATGAPELRWRNSNGVALPLNVALAAGLGNKSESVVLVTVRYTYVSPMSMILPQSQVFNEAAYARPRMTRVISLNGVV